MEIGLIKTNPCDVCKMKKGEKAEMHPLDKPDIKAFLVAIVGHKNEPLFKVDVFAGLRLGEILALEWSNIDFDSAFPNLVFTNEFGRCLGNTAVE